MSLALVLRKACHFKVNPSTIGLLRGPALKESNYRNFTLFEGKAHKAPALVKYGAQPKRNMSADHSKLWPIEKGLSVVLLAAIPAAVLYPSQILDHVVAASIVVHSHWGIEACVVDYVRPILFGPVIPKVSLGLLYLLSAFTLGSLFYYNYSDIGIGRTVRKLWAIKK